MVRNEFRDLADPDVAREAIEGLDLTAGAESVPIREARGRVLAERVDAPIDVPGFDRASMDGYAVRAEETFGATEDDPVDLPIVGTVLAGEDPATLGDATEEWSLGSEEAVQIATGAVMPPGADAVVPVERTIESEETVAITSAVTPGENVMPRGADIADGTRALGPGTRLGPRHVGLLAALGKETVPVRRRPRVAIVSTGEELVQPGDALDTDAGQIYDVNTHSIAAAVERAGGEPVIRTSPSDDRDRLRESLADAAEDCDLVLTSGSTSAGTVDMLYDLVGEHGEVIVHGVALKPGRPLLIGRVFGTPYIGLPGYPVSALTVFRTFVSGPLREAAGQPSLEAATVEATLGRRVRYEGGRLRLLPVGLVGDGSGELLAYTLSRGSGATTSLGETDGVVRMPAETNLLSAGESVDVERFDSTDPVPSLLGVGDPDPIVSGLLDALDSPRFIAMGQRDALRWLDDDIPDVLAVAPGRISMPEGAETLASFEREWGLVTTPASASEIDGLEDLQKGSFRFANLNPDLALRGAFDAILDSSDIDRDDIDGYHRELPGLESAARSVARGRADAGLGLRATADQLDLEFIPLGTQPFELVVNPDRSEKDGVTELASTASGRLEDFLADTPGYAPRSE
jgi:putative molybdopterin biosynthesis protein